LSLYAPIINTGNRKGHYLILDEANAVRNDDTLIHNALLQLRDRYDTCILMSGTPIDNNWMDAFGFLQFVNGHQLSRQSDFLRLFAEEDARKPGRVMPPRSTKFLRFMHLFMSYAFRRPKDMAPLPSLHVTQCGFNLNEQEQNSSGAAYQEYEDAKKESSGGVRRRGKKLSKRQKLPAILVPEWVSSLKKGLPYFSLAVCFGEVFELAQIENTHMREYPDSLTGSWPDHLKCMTDTTNPACGKIMFVTSYDTNYKRMLYVTRTDDKKLIYKNKL